MPETARTRLIKTSAVAEEANKAKDAQAKRAFGSRIEEAFLEAVSLLEEQYAKTGARRGQLDGKRLAKNRDEYTSEFVSALLDRMRADGLKVTIYRPEKDGMVSTTIDVSWEDPI